jgi:hypothetical protein
VVNVQLSKEGAMSSAMQLLDAAGRGRSPPTMPNFHAGRVRGNKPLAEVPEATASQLGVWRVLLEVLKAQVRDDAEK